MPLAFEDDLAAFFDPEEFGEAVHWNGEPATVIWNRPTGDLETPGGRYQVDTDIFMLPVTATPNPAEGDVVVVDRLGLSFRVNAPPVWNEDRTVATCEVEPA